MTDIRPIRDEESYSAALVDIEGYFGREPAPGTPEGDRFQVLLDLISAYEARRWPIELRDPVGLLIDAMELMGKTQSDLAQLIGSRPRASEILGRRRHMTIGQVYKISRAWGIPADALIAPYDLSA